MKKRGFSLILAFAMVLSLLPAAALAARPDEGFTDTRGHWGESSIDRWSGYDIIEGYEGLFYPDQNMTRGGVAKVLANLLGLTKQADLSGYTDIDSEAWYYEFMAKCVAAGIFEGDGANRLNPDEPISRQEMFTVFARALGIAPKADSDTQFTDDSQIASWAAGYIGALADQGIVTGGGDGSVDPTADIDRASVMALLDKGVITYVTTDGATVSGSDGIVLVVADNVTVTGSVDTLVVAGGSNTVTVSSGTVDNVAIVGPEDTVVFSGTSQAGDVTIPAAAEGSSVVVESGAAVDTVTSEASNVTISGSGAVDNAVVSGDNTSVSTGGTTVDVAEGTSGVTVNDTPVSGGETVETEPTTPETPPVHIHIYTWHDNGDETHTGVCACGMTTAAVAHTAGSNGKCTVCGAELEAKVGTVGYTKLENAINAAATGSTVTLVANVSYLGYTENTIVDMSGKTLDLNGHTISDGNYDTDDAIIFDGNDFTIQNGTFAGTQPDPNVYNYALWIGENGASNVTVSNVSAAGINIYNSTDVVLEDVTSVGNEYYAVWADEDTTVTIKSGTYSTYGSNGLLGALKNSSTATFPSSITVEGGTFTVNEGKFVPGTNDDNIKIYGGTYNADPSAYVASGYDALPTVQGSETWYTIVKGTVVSNETELTAALADTTVDTIYLANDIGLTAPIEVKRSVTIIGADEGSKLTISGSNDRVVNINDNTAAVTLTMKNVDVVGPTSGTYTRGISAYNNSGAIKIILDNCSVSCNYYALNIAGGNKNVEVEVKNGTYSAGWCAFQTWSPNTKAIFEDCTLIGNNDKAYNAEGWNDFATIVINVDTTNSELSFKNCRIEANQTTGNDQDLFSLRATGAKVTLDNCTVFANGSTISDEDFGDYLTIYYADLYLNIDGTVIPIS